MSRAAMEIDIIAGSGLDQIDKRLDATADRLERIAGLTDRIKSNIRGMGTGSSGGGGSSTSNSTSSGNSDSSSKGIRAPAGDRFSSGPNQRIIRLQEERERALQIQDPARRGAVLRDIEQGLFRARRSHIINERRLSQGDSATSAPGLLDYFQELNSFLRNPSGMLQPKMMARGIQFVEGAGGLNIEQKLASAGLPRLLGTGARAAAGAAGGEAAAGLGIGAEALAVAGPAIAVAAALALAAKAGDMYARETMAQAAFLRERMGAATVSGGTAGDIARLNAFGVGAGAAPGMANALRDRMQDPLAMLTAASLGVSPRLPQAYSGDQNNARLLREVLEGLRKERDPNEQLRKARILGVDGLLPELRYSNSVFNGRMREADLQARMDAQYGPAARNLAGRADLFSQQMDDIKRPVFAPGIDQAERALGGLNLVLEAIAQRAEQAEPFWRGLTDFVIDALPLSGAIRGLQQIGDADNAGGGETAQEALASSNYDLLDGIRQLVQQMRKPYGAGPYGESLQPRAIRNNPKVYADWAENSGYYMPLG